MSDFIRAINCQEQFDEVMRIPHMKVVGWDGIFNQWNEPHIDHLQKCPKCGGMFRRVKGGHLKFCKGTGHAMDSFGSL